MSPLFKRNDKTTIAELEEYYANQNNRTAKAWLMAILSLVLTVAVLAGLFFGGKWLYNVIWNNDDTPATISETANEGEQQDFDSDVVGDFTENDEKETDSDNVASNDQGVISDEAVSTTRDVAGETSDNSRTESTSNTTETTTTQESSSSEIPNTGSGDFVIVLVFITVTGYLISLKRQTN